MLKQKKESRPEFACYSGGPWNFAWQRVVHCLGETGKTLDCVSCVLSRDREYRRANVTAQKEPTYPGVCLLFQRTFKDCMARSGSCRNARAILQTIPRYPGDARKMFQCHKLKMVKLPFCKRLATEKTRLNDRLGLKWSKSFFRFHSVWC